jgi:hypothetical protein
MTDKQKKDGKAFETYNIEINRMYLNPKYTLSKEAANARTREGLLKVFKLNPSGDGPSFVGRWDGGSRDPGKKKGMTWTSTFMGFPMKRSFASRKGRADTLDTTRARWRATEDISTSFSLHTGRENLRRNCLL